MNSEPLVTRRMFKEYASLDDARCRRKAGMFVAEGSKCILELSARFHCRRLYALDQWIAAHSNEAAALGAIETSRQTLKELTRLSTTPEAIAFFDLPEAPQLPDKEYVAQNLTVALDRIQDPGNFGTILRCCDWMGVKKVVASPDTVDAFNPKAVQASMGALAHIDICYTELNDFVETLGDTCIYGTFLDGENIYTAPLGSGGLLIMGNEGRGISDRLAAKVSHRLLIPTWPVDAQAVESLNVAMATAICLSQFRARNFSSISQK